MEKKKRTHTKAKKVAIALLSVSMLGTGAVALTNNADFAIVEEKNSQGGSTEVIGLYRCCMKYNDPVENFYGAINGWLWDDPLTEPEVVANCINTYGYYSDDASIAYLKAVGMLPADYVYTGKKSSSSTTASTASTSSTSTSTSTNHTHSYDTEKVTKEATCTEVGTKTLTCSCGDSKTEEIPMIDHTYEVTSETPATCTEDGTKTLTCSMCGDTKEETVTALGHDMVESESVEASCAKEGYITRTCSVCGEEETETIPAFGHDLGEWETTKEASLFTDGEKVQKCSVCGEAVNVEVIPATCPIPLAGVIGIAVAVVAVIGGAIAVVLKKKKKKDDNPLDI